MKKLKVNFYNNIEDELLKFAVIVSVFKGKLVLCKHRQRTTYELPGGHREEKENINYTAKRELYEETGAVKYDIFPICVYSVKKDREETFGMLFYAEIYEFENELHNEIENIEFFDTLPDNLTYPDIQPKLIEKLKSVKYIKNP